jgi:pyruvate formate lyase activating enzyme
MQSQMHHIEKKPLFHFYPGSLSYSLGTIGCNFRCKHCQNWMISQISVDEAVAFEIPPETAVERVLATGSRSIAWTYNEPTIWHEYTYDSAKLAKEAGLATVYRPRICKTCKGAWNAYRGD